MPVRDELLSYYERELDFMRQTGAEFARRYPKVAGRLQLEADKCDDPHVERLLESFALLAARVHLKIDDESPDIVEALFSILYPHYIRPVPSMSIVQFHLDPEQGKLTTGLNIPRGSFLYTAPVNGMPCKFRTCFDTTLWPLRVHAAEWKTADRLRPAVPASNSVAAIRLELHCFQDVAFNKLDLETLRFFLTGGVANSLIELLSNNCVQIIARDLAAPAKKVIHLSPESVRQAGLAENESLIPFPRRSFWGYRLLQEYFSFPEKFLFLDISGSRDNTLDYLASVYRLGEPRPDLWLPAVPVDGQNANLYDTDWPDILADNYRLGYRSLQLATDSPPRGLDR